MTITRGSVTFEVEGDEEFWRNYLEWEKETFEIFDQYLTPSSIVVDIGAWIGPTVLYTAKMPVKKVYAVEPDRVAFSHLSANILLNDLQTVISANQCCIAPQTGNVTFGSKGAFGDSMSSLLFADRELHYEVEAFTLQDFFKKHQIEHCDFIKMDIEGGEFLIFQDIVDVIKTLPSKPVLYFSFHHSFWGDSNLHTHEIRDKFDKAFMELCELYNHPKDEIHKVNNSFYSLLMQNS